MRCLLRTVFPNESTHKNSLVLIPGSALAAAAQLLTPGM